MNESIKVTGKLENWVIFGNALMGKIFDDTKKRFKDGTVIKCSKLEKLDFSEGEIVKTKNSTMYFVF